MTLWNRFIPAVFSVILCLPLPLQAGGYTLSDLYRLAMERSEKIQLARENVTFTRLEKNRAIAALMPKLSAFGTYQRYSDDKYNDYNSLIQTKRSRQWGLRADQTMSLSLRELVMLSEATNDIQRARYDLDYLKESYLLEVARSFYTVLMARKGLEIAQSNLERVTKYRDAARTRLKVGEITRTVLLRAESELSGARSDLVKAENALTLANTALARVVGIEPGFTLEEEPLKDTETASLSELKSLALSERADLKSLEQQVKIAGQEVTYAQGAYWPNLSLAGVYQRTDQDPEPLNLNKESAYGALSLNFPFFEGGTRYAETQEAKVRERQAILQYEDQKKNVGLEVESAYLHLHTAKGSLKYLEDQVSFARDNYRGVSRQFDLGLASSIDLIDANNILVSSERGLAEAVYTHQLSLLSVEQATGTFMKDVNSTMTDSISKSR